MNVFNPAVLINLLGFTVGAALYGLLLAMAVGRDRSKNSSVDFLILTTAVLGLLWNTGELFSVFYLDFFHTSVSPLLSAASFSALGFLPSVVVHSAEKSKNKFAILTVPAYAVSILAAVIHFYSAFYYGAAPSDFALKILSFGSVALLAGLLLTNLKQTLDKKAVWASALLIFAVSAFHLSGKTEESSWLVELIAHQSSLPLAIAILIQDFRFAFADLFLKRAVSLILLALVAFALYVFVASPLLHYHETHDRNDAQAISLILILWMATALVYPLLHKFAARLVDRIILNRVDYEQLQTDLIKEIENFDRADEILELITRRISEALTAKSSGFEALDTVERPVFPFVVFSQNRAEVFVPTVETPFYKIYLEDFAGGRRLLSEETAMLEAVALLSARRIDAVRVTDERIRQEKREQEFSKLAAQAQLSALRAQINPHFLFNTLTTIGYLTKSDPDKAFETLMKFTKHLRESFRQASEFSTLGEEIELAVNYLEIEKARFEERLDVEIDVAEELKGLRVPALILQPLVENAVKHGISQNKNGGTVKIGARVESRGDETFLKLKVFDTGGGENANGDQASTAVGLKNIRERLESYYGTKAVLNVEINKTRGTEAEIILPAPARAAEKNQ